MSQALKITVFENRRPVHSEEYAEPVELGRQESDDDVVYRPRQNEGRWRIPIARKAEAEVARKQVLVEPLAEGRARLSNQSTGVPISLVEDGSELRPTSACEVTLPITLRIGPREVRIEPVHLKSLGVAPTPPGVRMPDRSMLATIALEHTPEGETLIPWLQATMDMLHGAVVSQESYDRAASALVEMTNLDSGRVLMLEGDSWVVKAMKVAGDRPPRLESHPPWRPSSHVLTRLREEKQTFWQVPQSRTASIRGVQALVAAPILDRQGQVIGALYGDRGEEGPDGPHDGRPITRLQAMLVQLLASGVAAGLAQKKLVQVERDLEIGRQMQAGFLPRALPRAPGWEIAAHFRPAREVSGDFYDAFALAGSRLALVIADVCDKGVGAALFMTLLRSLLRAFAEQAAARESAAAGEPHASSSDSAETDLQARLLPERIVRSAVEQTNDYMVRTHGAECMFCTVFFAILDPKSGSLTYINAGHDAPALLGGGVLKARLNPTGPIVGLEPNLTYNVDRVHLEPGDVLFAYTDGVTEARSPDGQFFTENRLLPILQTSTPSAASLVADVVAGLLEHIAGAEPHDDVTILTLRRAR